MHIPSTIKYRPLVSSLIWKKHVWMLITTSSFIFILLCVQTGHSNQIFDYALHAVWQNHLKPHRLIIPLSVQAFPQSNQFKPWKFCLIVCNDFERFLASREKNLPLSRFPHLHAALFSLNRIWSHMTHESP